MKFTQILNATLIKTRIKIKRLFTLMKEVGDFLYKDESYKIRGACFDVYNEFGGAFKESVTDKALSFALKERGLEVEDQKRIDIYYKDQKVGTYIPDKIVNGKILIELKSKPFFVKADVDQFWKYLKGSDYKLGFLINFGPEKLDIRRVVYDKCLNLRESAT